VRRRVPASARALRDPGKGPRCCGRVSGDKLRFANGGRQRDETHPEDTGPRRRHGRDGDRALRAGDARRGAARCRGLRTARLRGCRLRPARLCGGRDDTACLSSGRSGLSRGARLPPSGLSAARRRGRQPRPLLLAARRRGRGRCRNRLHRRCCRGFNRRSLAIAGIIRPRPRRAASGTSAPEAGASQTTEAPSGRRRLFVSTGWIRVWRPALPAGRRSAPSLRGSPCSHGPRGPLSTNAGRGRCSASCRPRRRRSRCRP